MKIRPQTVAMTLSMALASSLPAQVTVVNRVSSGALTTLGLTQFAFTYTPVTPGNTLVFSTYVDNGSTGTAVTFDGVAAEGFVHNGRSTLAYTRTSDASVNIVVTLSATGNANSGYVIYELSGVAAGTVDLSTTNTIATTGDTKFVVSFAGVNNAAVTGASPAVGSIIPGANAAVADWNSTAGGGGLAYGHGSAGLMGSQALGWTFPSGGGVGTVAAAFPTGVNPDSDGDGLLDVWENANFGNLTAARGTQAQSASFGANWDHDSDGFDNEAEETAGSDPNNADSIPGDIDGDDFADSAEIASFGNLSQTPGSDYDGDYATNQAEATAGTSPTNAALWPDTDGDLMADAWETAHGLVVGTNDSAAHADGDGFTNLQEFQAGTDPQDTAWAPGKATLAHRWSFTGNLTDSVGGSDAQIANNDTPNVGLSSTQNATDLKLAGGAKATSDYILLGENLLSDLQAAGGSPVTIELWATQDSVQNWARIFDFGVNDGNNPIANESLRMTWTQGATLGMDQVAWEPTASWAPANSPYVTGVSYHIVMTIVPAAFTNGSIASGAQVTWYSAPASGSQATGHPLYGARGTFNTPVGTDLRALLDDACTLGRSLYGDNTASASYDEVRIWKGALSETERELFQLIGPDSMNRIDSEPDAFPDAWEMERFGNLTTATVGGDADGDGETDDAELAAETNPNDIQSIATDSDKDNLVDTWERQYFNNLLQLGTDDPDMDFADNASEQLHGTNPTNRNSSPDTDGDGISDGWEMDWFSDLTTADSTLRSGGTSTNADGDFDSDLQEFQGGFSPINEFSGRDTENSGAGDGLPDYWEFFYFQPLVGANYLNIVVPSQDYEPDGATNAEEFADATNPVDGNDFKDVNDDNFYDGILLAATDGFGATSFNAGTNWPGAVAPVAGKSYLVTTGMTLRTPNVANQTTVFAGARLALAESQFLLKGANSIAQADYVFDGVTVRNGEDASQPITVAGTIMTVDPSTLFADNGDLILTAKLSGSGDLTLNGNATVIRQVRFDNTTNDWTGDLTLNPTASLVVNGTLSTGTASTYNIRPRATGVSNSIGGAGTLNLAGTLKIDLSAVVPSNGAAWNLITVMPTYHSGFTVVDSASLAGGFTAGAGAVGSRLWTSGDGDYVFDESTGVLSFTGTIAGYTFWASASSLTAGVNEGAEANPDGDAYGNVLEYQLKGNPLANDNGLVTLTSTATHLIFTFQRYDLSETDSTLSFRWSPDLVAWTTVPIGATSSGPNANGVVVTVTEDGGSNTDYDLIQVQLPKSNAVDRKLFGRLQGSQH